MDDLLNHIYYRGPQAFRSSQLPNASEVFKSRAALYFTPTSRLPSELIGAGHLDITIPVAFPTVFDVDQHAACWCPRIWVDLLQRQTQKLRWKPMNPAQVRFVRYDSYVYSETNLWGGVKALLDALKVSTSGRRDGRVLYYFGVIADDNPKSLASVSIAQELVNTPSEAKTRILVEPAS